MDHKLFQQQSQKLILSPQIRQYLKLLQLPVAELQQAVEAELTENPVLEERQKEPSEETPLPEESREKNPSEITADGSFENLEKLDDNFKESLQYTDFSRQSSSDMEEWRNFQETLITRPEGLSDFLMGQVRFLEITDDEKKIAEEIIGNIDDDGYLRATLDEIAAASEASVDAVTKVLHEVQQLEPAGIGARDLQETILIQLKRKLENHDCPESVHQALELALKITEQHLPLLEKRDHQALARAFSENPEHIKEAAFEISKLSPKPGRNYAAEETIPAEPDGAIVPDEDNPGAFKVELFDERIPEIRINPYYRKMLRTKGLDEKSKTFLKEKIQSALNFMQAINLRKSTLRLITEAIVKAQTPFLEKGFSHLNPLRLKDIADTIGIHESTVSRAIQGKYALTPQGMIAYKSFFSTRMETSEGPAESQKSIMEKIKGLIEKEDPKHPLSDQDLLEKMKTDGIVIARRTVAKYRELLRILPSHMRRQK